MKVEGSVALVTGGASGLGLATATRLARGGAKVVIADLPGSPGEQVAADLGCRFAPADVTDPEQVTSALDAAAGLGPLRALVHCAGRGGTVRVVDREGAPGSLEDYTRIVTTNLIGSYNVIRLAAARMSATEPVDGERGVCVLTASVAAYEGQIGQVAYASSKAGVVGMTLVAARDLSRRLIRVCSIAPGVFDTPMLGRLPEEVRASLGAAVPHPSRLGDPADYAALAEHIIANPMLNGETIRLDGAIRMAPR
ncbi:MULTISPECIES: SDR family NAD(P)-dependent oxidoreductase [Nonomuraea]|uniref:SDR family NAD(P)-dependent oxidoreductase n=2 Tax=Nonomuraea TaxID=83681 RepID=A0ABW1C8Y8_9ACTN|nr:MULTISPECIES: SDR family NAD(P)-dependent oxidoreductase [Nonomuraea]MDA0647186.1 SDR family NAD(P)-dependent oxidoreductase [Nonomuraea ferruginea]